MDTYSIESYIYTNDIMKDFYEAEKAFRKGNFDLFDLLIQEFNDKYPAGTYRECYLLKNRRKNRLTRAKKRIGQMLLSGQCWFITLTFNDNAFIKYNAETRKKAVSEFLSAYAYDYVANIDYGSKNEREHYHAVVLLKNRKIDLSKWQEKYGAVNVRKCRTSKNDKVAMSKYITKLTNHAIKMTTKRTALMYCRKPQY